MMETMLTMETISKLIVAAHLHGTAAVIYIFFNDWNAKMYDWKTTEKLVQKLSKVPVTPSILYVILSSSFAFRQSILRHLRVRNSTLAVSNGFWEYSRMAVEKIMLDLSIYFCIWLQLCHLICRKSGCFVITWIRYRSHFETTDANIPFSASKRTPNGVTQKIIKPLQKDLDGPIIAFPEINCSNSQNSASKLIWFCWDDMIWRMSWLLMRSWKRRIRC